MIRFNRNALVSMLKSVLEQLIKQHVWYAQKILNKLGINAVQSFLLVMSQVVLWYILKLELKSECSDSKLYFCEE